MRLRAVEGISFANILSTQYRGVEMVLQDILSDIHDLEEELLFFERKYGIRSETFNAAYAAGEEPKMTTGLLISANGPVYIALGFRDRQITEMKYRGCSRMHKAWKA